MRRLFLLFFLLTLSCSKDESEDKADIVIPSYQVSVQSSEGGSVSTTGGTYQSGGSLSVTATPNDGYKFTGWSGDDSGTVNPLTINVSRNANITANFERIKYELNVAIEGKGEVTQTIISSSKKGEEYNSGTVVRLKATPESGSIFYNWSGSSTETFSEIDITIDGSKSVTATFEEQIFQLVDENNVFIGTGRWKIRKPNTG